MDTVSMLPWTTSILEMVDAELCRRLPWFSTFGYSVYSIQRLGAAPGGHDSPTPDALIHFSPGMVYHQHNDSRMIQYANVLPPAMIDGWYLGPFGNSFSGVCKNRELV